MQVEKGKIMSKSEFLSKGSYGKEQYEGLLVGSDARQGCYNIGVQLDEDKVLVVDHAHENNVRERILDWSSQIEDIQRKHGTKADLQNYTRDRGQ